jgi:hypothetical protein
MVQNEDASHEHLLRFDSLWCSGVGLGSCLIYSSGRSPVLYKELWVSQGPMAACSMRGET